jgi:hypothetical protein
VPTGPLAALPVGAPAGPYLAAAALDDDVVVLGPAGGLVRIAPDGASEVTDTEGIDGGEEGVLEVRTTTMTATADGLLAVGEEQDLVADVIPATRPVLWRSTDGRTWDEVEPEGLEAGTDEVRLAAVAVTDDGLLALGSIDAEEGTVLALWGSTDGARWQREDAPGLAAIGADDRFVYPLALAAAGDTVVATVRIDGQDDERLEVLRAPLGGAWEVVATTGLEPLDLPNTDVLAPLATLGDGFALFGNVPVDEAEEFGERRAAVFTSADGTDWAVEVLDGPALAAPEANAALVTTADGATGLTGGTDGLTIWRITP